MVMTPHDTRRAVMLAAHRHFRRMASRHSDWPFASSLRIEQGKAHSVSAQMARIRAAIEVLNNLGN
jgi:hypothetical protein